MNHLLSMEYLTTEDIYSFIKDAEAIISGDTPKIDSKGAIGNLFFEPSTRTKLSFEMAAYNLGLNVLNFSEETSSTKKGESLYDTVKTIEAIGASLLVIRHPEDSYFEALKDKVSIPIINAGDGKGQHPTQCLLDLLTIYQSFKSFAGLKVVISGDIAHSRVARSNAYALTQLGAEVHLSAPEKWRDASLPYSYLSMDEAVEWCDVLMLLRVQHERHSSSEKNSLDFHKQFGLTIEREKKMKKDAIILHPAPVNRGVEIADELVECERSKIFKQMENGVAIRMAIINRLLSMKGEAKHVHSI